MEKFISIKENVQTEIVVKKSKFICNLIKIESQEEAEDYMESDMPDNKKTHPFQVRPAIYNRCHHF